MDSTAGEVASVTLKAREPRAIAARTTVTVKRMVSPKTKGIKGKTTVPVRVTNAATVKLTIKPMVGGQLSGEVKPSQVETGKVATAMGGGKAGNRRQADLGKMTSSSQVTEQSRTRVAGREEFTFVHPASEHTAREGPSSSLTSVTCSGLNKDMTLSKTKMNPSQPPRRSARLKIQHTS
ncbi:hypothetical protein TREMEDRAFT_57702 [Tremella mesenterica DSM 1558]|uniref:uncharacterized protein n=1 Tax=Tremella mesenterica (strain ATCC 24925 / CBS 8224 / DSM 1558 / NBRC 9311 / NRRL Y-6157 / RJB 2259-6 / UBC 559-6) TaxID=578456 RepID=UPI00032C9AF9|nr:uncharacterized protein TREMEDRAFT_57702 [Tremella mesenterica DSM 1558]EIW66821.1 hypothetical protein TREMEDRAFT_57702 [Tremella mesenterica DSM 1558]